MARIDLERSVGITAALIHCEEHMADVIRRVVTGHDRSGKAVVLADGPATAVRTNPLRPGYKSTDIWKTTAMPVPAGLEEADPTLGPMDFVPRFGIKSDGIRLFRPGADRMQPDLPPIDRKYAVGCAICHS